MDIYYDESGREHVKPVVVEPEWRVGGYVVVQREDGRLLMVQPTWTTDHWELPGGGLDKTETLQEGVIRECYEETGYRIRVDEQPFYVADRNFCKTNTGGKQFLKSVIIVYAGHLLGEGRNTELLNQEMDEIAKVEWVDIATLTEANTQPIVWPVIQKLQLSVIN